MRFLGVVFYATVIILIGLILITLSVALSFKPATIPAQDIANLIANLENSFSARLSILFSGILLILISFSFAQLILGRFQREKTIAFATSGGEVTISLTAVEDLIRRLSNLIPEIRELRPDVVVHKKRGITVDLRVILKSEANIPELTMRLQDIIRTKIQEVLGVEEQIVVKIHVVKIISKNEKEFRQKNKSLHEDEPTIPFGGYARA